MELLEFDKLDSTNSYAKANIEQLSDKTIITTKHQTNGRGRLQREWLDLGDNNLYMTIVLKPELKDLNIYSNLTQYLSVILCKLLESYNLTPQIKWPNDVLINGAKIAGILSESIVSGTNIKGILIGIGVNLNVKKENLTLVTDKKVTSLNLETGKTIDIKEFRENLCNAFFAEYDDFISNGFEYIKTDYINRVYFLDTEVSIQGYNSITTGIAKEITNDGTLKLLDKENKEHIIYIGDIL